MSCSVQFNSVTQLCPTLCDPMNSSTPGLPVHQLLKFTQTHVHWVSDAIQPSHPLSSPSPPAPNPSQHQSLFQWVKSSYEVACLVKIAIKWRFPRVSWIYIHLYRNQCNLLINMNLGKLINLSVFLFLYV